MHFCTQCQNMYYLKIRDEENTNSLVYYCRNCGHEDSSLTADSVCVSDTQLRRSEQKYTHIVNEYTKHDPTLPRINTIKCPNQECSSNLGVGVGGHPPSAPHGGDLYLNFEGGAGKGKGKGTGTDTSTNTSTVKKTITVNKPATTKKSKIATIREEEKEEESATMKESAHTVESNAIVAASHAIAASHATASHAIAASHAEAFSNSDREIIYIRYDDINMKYIYLCARCDTMWKTDNRN